jgi:6-phosphogluconolactonase (cycloisomerase 2 family)
VRRRAVGSLVALAVVAASPVVASAQDMEVASDGRHLYVGGLGHRVFAVDPVSGELTTVRESQLDYIRSLGGAMAVAPDGRFLYFGETFVRAGGILNSSYGSVHAMARDAATGLLTHEGSVFGGPYPGSSNVGRVGDLILSPDSRHVYVYEWSPQAVRVFERSPTDGTLSEVQVIYPEDGLPTSDLRAIALTPDGRDLLLAGNKISVMRRDAASGRLSDARIVDPYGYFHDLTVSPDGARVYARGAQYVAFSRDLNTGDLTKLPRELKAPCDCSSNFLEVSPDGTRVFTTWNHSPVFGVETPLGSMVQARVVADGLELEREYRDDGWDEFDPTAMTWSADGRTAYLLSRSLGLAARRYANGVLEPAVYAERYSDSTSEWFWRSTITVNDGALYTNDPDVTVSIEPPRGAFALKLSNGAGDFARSPSLRIGPGKVRTYPWRLDTSEPGRSAKRVHVRFNPTGPDVIELFDDIVLDQTPPALITAQLDGSRVRVRARDNRSGVKHAQLTTNRKKPGRSRKFKSTLPSPSARKPVFVRVLDGAGNSSRWRRARP